VADSLLALMTPDEKLGQLTMFPGASGQTGPAVPPGGEEGVRAGRVGSFLSLYGVADTRRLQRVAVEQSRLKIPLLFSFDVIHGWRTIFPVPLAQAATFDSAAVAGAARVAAAEAASQGVHWTFAPMVDVARDPRWGRVVEGAGEDPVLGSVMAAAQVAGFQGAPALLAGAAAPPPDVLLATPKHFAGYGFAEGGRDYNTVELTERTLWDVVLPPFEAAIRAGAATLMAAFNEVGGTPAHASRFLLQDVLRDRWRFGGLVVSDWTGVAELIPHGLGDSAAVAARALAAGVDVEMSSALYRTTLGAQAPRRARPPGRRRLGGGARAPRQVGARAVRRPVPLQRHRPRRAHAAARRAPGGGARRRPRGGRCCSRTARPPRARRPRSRCGATCARWP
jgi:beta-glucosidase